MMYQRTDKQALLDWEDFRQQMANATTIDYNETEEDRQKRMADLEKDPEKWFKYYFPKYCFAEPAAFQIKSTKKILQHSRFSQSRAWCRGLSKSTRRMMEVLYIMLANKFRINALLLSKNEDNASKLLAPYMVSLDSNQRIINDYGVQEKPGSWTIGDFTTRGGCAFRAVGKKQNPRGAKNEELRVNVIIADDLDDDEECRNTDRIGESWSWFEQAVLPTVDIAKPYYIFFDNNIIAPDSLQLRFSKKAMDVEIVNIRDEKGKSTWPEKNSEKDIDDMLKLLSWEAAQQEYFNNPVRQGQTFKEIHWGKCPPMHTMQFLLQYADPATSNKDKPTAKSKANNSMKGTALMGFKDEKFYLYKCYLDNMSNSDFLDGMFAIRDHVGGRTHLYSIIENNSLQDPFYEQVLKPLAAEKAKTKGGMLALIPDESKKGDKWVRIEASLEPLVRLGLLIFNIEEQSNPHMMRMASQFLTATPNSRELGGPDMVQGAVQMIKQKTTVANAKGGTRFYNKPHSSKMF